MNITEFFILSTGKWFSQRTVHNLILSKINSQSFFMIQDYILLDSIDVKNKLLTLKDLDTTQKFYSFHTHSKDFLSIPYQCDLLLTSKSKYNELQGKVLKCSTYDYEYNFYSGTYDLQNSNTLNIVSSYKDFIINESFWFVNPNLRLSTTVVKKSDILLFTSFSSDIRV